MGQKIITLSGAATDVLYALFFRGALQSGDLPAKSGAAELRELGFAETRHTATEYQKENYFTFLTAEGQEFAIKHLVDTRFGKPVDKQYRSAITIGVELDTSDVQKTIDELDDIIRNSDAFKALNDIYQLPRMKISADQQVMNTVADALDEVSRRYFDVFGYPETGKTKAVALAGRWVAIEGIYTLEEIRDAVEYIKRLRKQKADEKAMAESSPYFVKDGQVFIKDAFIGNAIKTSVKLSPEMEKAISDAVSAELKKNLKPGGTIWDCLRRGF
ncbi:Fur-regulated protein [Enterobacter ludwigii]|uniref:Fur-regulated protein n=1 Tax=Enterobacter ludwigii TaxID=299767 RepID=UPI002A7F1D98|nr:Fur-regulated protein [Enterobacter ludwigii]